MDRELADRIVAEFVERSWNSATWDNMIKQPCLKPFGCLIDALGLECSREQRDEIGFRGAAALRRAFPRECSTPTAWKLKRWRPEERLRILEIVETAAGEVLSVNDGQRSTSGRSGFSPIELDANGFVRWRHFLSREPVIESPGVYVLGKFDGAPPREVAVLEAAVIYIGMTDRSLRHRLIEFENTARGGSAHSGGWTYRTEYAQDDFEAVTTFPGLYITWIESLSARELEASLLEEYLGRWGRWPILNKKG